jgi:hypothetical protein
VAHMRPGNFIIAILGSHEVGIPQMTVAKGLACGPYSSFMIDPLGHKGRAEW